MRFYVDFDDCLCETARAFTGIADRMFGRKIPYEDVRFFNLQESFDLTDEQYAELMTEGHRPETVLSYEETPNASKVLNEWIDAGHEVDIITGRSSITYDSSREWLDNHGLERTGLYCLNKYGRNFFSKNGEYNLEPEDFYKMHFDVAIDDSPISFKFFTHFPELKVMLFDRPWNREFELTNDNYCRCRDWNEIKTIVDKSPHTLYNHR